MLHCRASAKERNGLLKRAFKVQPGFDAMPRPKRAQLELRVMLRSDSPKSLNPHGHVCRYLMLFLYSRQHQLRTTTMQGEGLRPNGTSWSCTYPRLRYPPRTSSINLELGPPSEYNAPGGFERTAFAAFTAFVLPSRGCLLPF